MPDATFTFRNNDIDRSPAASGHAHARRRPPPCRSQAEEAELKRIAENISESPYAILVIDAEGRIALANDALNSVYGYLPGAVVGERLEILSGQYQRAEGADEIDVDRLLEDVINAVSLPDHILIETAPVLRRFRGVRTAVATSLYDLLCTAVRQCVCEDSRIAITCNEDAGYGVFTIADCSIRDAGGRGEKPPQTNGSAAVRHSGVGVDVAETRKLIEAHGGLLAIEPATATHGPTYHVSWPMTAS